MLSKRASPARLSPRMKWAFRRDCWASRDTGMPLSVIFFMIHSTLRESPALPQAEIACSKSALVKSTRYSSASLTRDLASTPFLQRVQARRRMEKVLRVGGSRADSEPGGGAGEMLLAPARGRPLG